MEKREKLKVEIGKELKLGTEQMTTREEMLDLLKKYDKYILEYPEELSGYGNRSVVEEALGLYQLALDDLNRVTDMAPTLHRGWLNKGLVMLRLGRLKEGWQYYEWRRGMAIDNNDFPQKTAEIGLPYWSGEKTAENQKLFVYAEQGMGDNIQFFRFILEAKKKGEHLSVLNKIELDTLLRYNLEQNGIEIFENGAKLTNDIKYFAFSMSLPYCMKIDSLEKIPYTSRYLDIPPQFEEKWKKKLRATKKKKIGIFWTSDSEHKKSRFRNVPFEKIKKLFSLDAKFHCLQKNVTEEDRRAGEKVKNLYFWDTELEDFCDTAALINQMDLVITVDTSVAHLAGALGKPTWIMLAYHPDFRWLLDREDSPWYDSVRLFRQNEDYQWDNVIEKIKNELREAI